MSSGLRMDREYLLDEVKEDDREDQLGFGSRSSVDRITVKYKGTKCTAKRIFSGLLQSASSLIAKECMLHAKLLHPNILQFLGYYYSTPENLHLVTEFIPASLANCIDRNGVLPDAISYSILQDIALGLRYLHERHEPIIHRDLTAGSVFLTDDMTAKIGDFGVAAVTMTPIPGKLSFLPPEAFRHGMSYGIKLDIFSYGVLMVHMFCGEWPHSLKESTLSEVDRRHEYLDSIGHEHPLMGLITQCLSNDPADRPTAAEIHEIESNASSHFCSSKQEELYRLQQYKRNQIAQSEHSRRFDMILKKAIGDIPASEICGYVRSELPIPESNQLMLVAPFQGNQQAESDQSMSVQQASLQQAKSDQSMSVVPHQQASLQQAESDQSMAVVPHQQASLQQAESDQSMSVVPHQQASKVIHDHTSYLNYHLVEDMVEKFGDNKLKAEMKEYRTDLEKFRKQTTIREFVVPSTGKHIEKFESLGENYIELSVKLDKDSKVTTLEDIERLRHVIARELSIPPHATVLYAIEEGSLFAKTRSSVFKMFLSNSCIPREKWRIFRR